MKDIDLLYRTGSRNQSTGPGKKCGRSFVRISSKNSVKSGDTVLDLGCGFGEFIRFIDAEEK